MYTNMHKKIQKYAYKIYILIDNIIILLNNYTFILLLLNYFNTKKKKINKCIVSKVNSLHWTYKYLNHLNNDGCLNYYFYNGKEFYKSNGKIVAYYT